MRAVAAAFAVLAVTASRSGCGDGASGYDPCGGKGCADACTLCAPGDAGCAESAEQKVCDPRGQCVPASTTSFTCEVADACAGKACGQPCVVALPCQSASPPCLAPVAAGTCDYGGNCVPGGAVSCMPVDSCMDQACGVPCSDSMMMGCSMMMGSPCACDGTGTCVSAAMLACPMQDADPCSGKSCGDACDPCGGMCGHPFAMACDRNGQCVVATPGTCPGMP